MRPIHRQSIGALLFFCSRRKGRAKPTAAFPEPASLPVRRWGRWKGDGDSCFVSLSLPAAGCGAESRLPQSKSLRVLEGIDPIARMTAVALRRAVHRLMSSVGALKGGSFPDGMAEMGPGIELIASSVLQRGVSLKPTREGPQPSNPAGGGHRLQAPKSGPTPTRRTSPRVGACRGPRHRRAGSRRAGVRCRRRPFRCVGRSRGL